MALMPEVQFLVTDPDLGAQPFTVTRKTGAWQGGRLVIDPETGTQTIQAAGVIVPPQPEEMDRFPEGERRKDLKAVYTQTMLHVSDGDSVSDKITWHGASYKIVRVDRWDDWGFCVAYAAKE